MYLCICVYPSIHLSVYLSNSPSLLLSISPSIHLSVYLAYLPMCTLPHKIDMYNNYISISVYIYTYAHAQTGQTYLFTAHEFVSEVLDDLERGASQDGGTGGVSTLRCPGSNQLRRIGDPDPLQVSTTYEFRCNSETL